MLLSSSLTVSDRIAYAVSAEKRFDADMVELKKAIANGDTAERDFLLDMMSRALTSLNYWRNS